MYEANFPEDTERFVDYYYTYKTADNRILVMENAGKPEVMIHLNPYVFRIYGQPALVNYVVAVATDASARRQGKMAAVMEHALRDMAKEHQPFTFLIPANPAVYRSSGFAFVDSEDYADYDAECVRDGGIAAGKVGTKVSETDCRMPERERLAFTCQDCRLRKAETSDIPAMVRFANALLEREYDIFPEHTEAYYRRMMAEMACQDGGFVLLVGESTPGQERISGQESISGQERISEQERISGQERRKSQGKESEQIYGIFSYGRDGERAELQELLVEAEYRRELFMRIREWQPPLSISKMDFMFRILDLRALVPMLRSRESCMLKVQVMDRILPENAGAYKIVLDRAGGTIADISAEETECVMDIAELTRYLFDKTKIFTREWV